MVPKLRSGLSCCVIDGKALFLDVVADRYFQLAPAANQAVLSLLTGTWPQQSQLADLHAMGIIDGCSEGGKLAAVDSAPPRKQATAVSEGHFSLPDVAQALWRQRRVEMRLSRQSLEIVLSSVASAKSRISAIEAGLEAERRILRAFEYAKILRSGADRCLPRSIALSLCLSKAGIAADLIFGVRLGPFIAHCWVQRGGAVLNDTVEGVARFTPILVV
jgi:hypothetical protein